MPSNSQSRVLPYTPQQMFDLVADVANYPKFLPWTAAARIRSTTPHQTHDIIIADLIVSFKVFRERFGSRVTLWHEDMKVDTAYIDGPFKHLNSRWVFEKHPDGCTVHFDIDFEFKNKLLQGAAGLFFQDAMARIVQAFEGRAREIYG